MNCENDSLRQYNAALNYLEQGDTATALGIAQELPEAYKEPIYAIGTKRLVKDGKLESAIAVANYSRLCAECTEPIFHALRTMSDAARVRKIKQLIPTATTIAYFWRLISANQIDEGYDLLKTQPDYDGKKQDYEAIVEELKRSSRKTLSADNTIKKFRTLL